MADFSKKLLLFLCFWISLCASQYNVLPKQVKVNRGTHKFNVAPSSVVLNTDGIDVATGRLKFEFQTLHPHERVIYIAWAAYDTDNGPSCVYYTKFDTAGHHLLATDQLLNEDCNDNTIMERTPQSMKFNQSSWLIAYSRFNVTSGQSLGIHARVLSNHCPDCVTQPPLALVDGVSDGMFVVLTDLFPTKFGFVVVWTKCEQDNAGPNRISTYLCAEVDSTGTIWAGAFDSTGGPLGDVFQVDDSMHDQRWATGASNLYPISPETNEIYFSWTRLYKDQKQVEVWGKSFTYLMNGTVEHGFSTRLTIVEHLTIPLPSVAEIPDGGFVVVWTPPLPTAIKEDLNCISSDLIFDTSGEYICDGEMSYANCSMLNSLDDFFKLETSIFLYDLRDATLFHQSEDACLVDLSIQTEGFCGTFSPCDNRTETELCSDPLSDGVLYDIEFKWDGASLHFSISNGTSGGILYNKRTDFSTSINFQDASSFICYDGNVANEARFYGYFSYIRATKVQDESETESESEISGMHQKMSFAGFYTICFFVCIVVVEY